MTDEKEVSASCERPGDEVGASCEMPTTQSGGFFGAIVGAVPPPSKETSDRVASLAGRGLATDDLTPDERKQVYASALTQSHLTNDVNEVLNPAAVGSATGDQILQYFEYSHLPPVLQRVSMRFCALAIKTIMQLPRNPERTVALRKLLESKDAAVRAALSK